MRRAHGAVLLALVVWLPALAGGSELRAKVERLRALTGVEPRPAGAAAEPPPCTRPRPGTRALDLADDLAPAEKHERLQRLQQHQKSIQARRMEAWLGRKVEVLVEGRSKTNAERWTGHTVDARVVNFEGDSAAGRFEHVEIEHATPFSLTGRVSAGELDRGRPASL